MSVPMQERQIRTFQDILRALQEEPSLREQLRLLLLSEELLRLPEEVAKLTAAVSRLEQQVSALAEAQQRTERRLEELAAAQARTEERVGRLEEAVARLAEAQARTERRLEELAAAQARTEERVGRLEERVGRLEEAMARLAEAQARTERRLEELAAAQARTEQRLQELAIAQQAIERRLRRLEDDVGELKGESLERRYRERAASYFQHVLRRIRLIDHQELGLLLDDAVDRGDISLDERAEVLHVDVVVHGVRDGQEVYLVAEVSGTITAGDVERAVRRAALLEKATGQRALAAVAGKRLSRAAQEHAAATAVWTVLDGRSIPPAT